ncbi:unknown [Clostridium sp. CAG:81]|nr:unknown [Clostridium sp. CAG:81]
MQPGGVLALSHINLQADFSIHLADLEPVVVLQGKQSVHEPYIGVYVRDGEGMGRDIQYLG